MRKKNAPMKSLRALPAPFTNTLSSSAQTSRVSRPFKTADSRRRRDDSTSGNSGILKEIEQSSAGAVVLSQCCHCGLHVEVFSGQRFVRGTGEQQKSPADVLESRIGGLG